MPRAEPRIAFCLPRYGPDVVGGAETLCRLVAENLAADGTPVEVLTTTAVDHFTWADHHPEGTTVEGGVPVHRFPVSRTRDGERFWSRHVAIASGEKVDYAGQLEWMAQSVWSPELQQAAEAPGRYDWLIGVPYLFGVGFWAAASRPERTAFIPCVHDEPHAWSDVVRDALTGARGNLLNSDGERDLLSRLAPRAEWRIVGVGFDADTPPSDDEVASFCAARGISPGYLLYAGRREEAKGLPLLFAHYAALLQARPDAPKLALMGSGDLAIPEDIAPWTVDLGYVPTVDRAAAYAGASLLVHPSRLESLGMVMLEAWLAGTPALVNGGSPVLVQHCRASGGGLWFADREEFVAAAGELLDDPPLRAAMARAGAAYVSGEFSWAEVRRRFRGALADWS